MGVKTRPERPALPPQRAGRHPNDQMTGPGSEGIAGTSGGRASEKTRGCPDRVMAEGEGTVDLGATASLTLADGGLQLVVAGQVTKVSRIRPAPARITRCLQEGEAYLGTVTGLSVGLFEAELKRVSTN